MQDVKAHGQTKIFLEEGRIFIGNTKEEVLDNGRMYEIQADGTYNEYEVIYDQAYDKLNKN